VRVERAQSPYQIKSKQEYLAIVRKSLALHRGDLRLFAELTALEIREGLRGGFDVLWFAAATEDANDAMDEISRQERTDLLFGDAARGFVVPVVEKP
jgi:hypothetical protein